MKLGITGTKKGGTSQQLLTARTVLLTLKPDEVHLGDCVGVDDEIRLLCIELGLYTVGHPPIEKPYRAFGTFNEIRPEKTRLARNDDIINETSVLMALPRSFTNLNRSGTWYTYRHAVQAQKKTILILPDGTRGEAIGAGINTTRRNN